MMVIKVDGELSFWESNLPEFTEQAANEYYRPKVDFGLFANS